MLLLCPPAWEETEFGRAPIVRGEKLENRVARVTFRSLLVLVLFVLLRPSG